jgi:hypothetical protein
MTDRVEGRELTVNSKLVKLGMASLVLSSCVVVPPDFDEDDYRPRERARSECSEEAFDQGYRRVDIQNQRSIGRAEWEVMMQGRDRTGREVRLRCEYDARSRRARVSRVDR